jgi:hypothetical protein
MEWMDWQEFLVIGSSLGAGIFIATAVARAAFSRPKHRQ